LYHSTALPGRWIDSRYCTISSTRRGKTDSNCLRALILASAAAICLSVNSAADDIFASRERLGRGGFEEGSWEEGRGGRRKSGLFGDLWSRKERGTRREQSPEKIMVPKKSLNGGTWLKTKLLCATRAQHLLRGGLKPSKLWSPDSPPQAPLEFINKIQLNLFDM
jgi:hypothetical protein